MGDILTANSGEDARRTGLDACLDSAFAINLVRPTEATQTGLIGGAIRVTLISQRIRGNEGNDLRNIARLAITPNVSPSGLDLIGGGLSLVVTGSAYAFNGVPSGVHYVRCILTNKRKRLLRSATNAGQTNANTEALSHCFAICPRSARLSVVSISIQAEAEGPVLSRPNSIVGACNRVMGSLDDLQCHVKILLIEGCVDGHALGSNLKQLFSGKRVRGVLGPVVDRDVGIVGGVSGKRLAVLTLADDTVLNIGRGGRFENLEGQLSKAGKLVNCNRCRCGCDKGGSHQHDGQRHSHDTHYVFHGYVSPCV